MWQIEQLQIELQVQAARSLKYYNAFNYLMDNFDKLPDDIKKTVDKRLKDIGL